MSTALAPPQRALVRQQGPHQEARVGCFSVEVELTNHSDELFQKLVPDHEIRSKRVWGRVDTAADLSVVPEWLAQELGLPEADRLRMTLADGREVTRQTVTLRLSWTAPEGDIRSGIFEAVVEPGVESDPGGEFSARQADMLIGAMALQRWDVYADCPGHQLVPRRPGVITCFA
jgi:hypothetical protein